MADRAIDGVLTVWGDRLFYPGNRIVRSGPQPKLSALAAAVRTSKTRDRIEAHVVRRAPQVMVKVTGGGRGMKAIAAHLRYISKNGRLEMEDERGEVARGKGAVTEIAEDWRVGGTRIDDVGHRREAYNIMLSMPRGTDPLAVQRAAREFAEIELADHKYVMVLHDHQANPHVHISVRAESRSGVRLNPRKSDLHRWRETFAERLRGWGIDAEATRQATRGVSRNYEPLWRISARHEGRLKNATAGVKTGARAARSRSEAIETWKRIASILASSSDAKDRQLSRSVSAHVRAVVQESLHREATRVEPADRTPMR